MKAIRYVIAEVKLFVEMDKLKDVLNNQDKWFMRHFRPNKCKQMATFDTLEDAQKSYGHRDVWLEEDYNPCKQKHGYTATIPVILKREYEVETNEAYNHEVVEKTKVAMRVVMEDSNACIGYSEPFYSLNEVYQYVFYRNLEDYSIECGGIEFSKEKLKAILD